MIVSGTSGAVFAKGVEVGLRKQAPACVIALASQFAGISKLANRILAKLQYPGCAGGREFIGAGFLHVRQLQQKLWTYLPLYGFVNIGLRAGDGG